MFLDTSRYAKVETVQTKAADGRTVQALALRRLPPTPGDPAVVKDNDQLDVIAQERYGDGTRFWHVADANSELEATRLLDETGGTVNVPAT